MYNGMLRITLPSANVSGLFVLEGKLAGLWAQELLRVAREVNQGDGNIFDLQEVFYVDSTGEEALRRLSRHGARFIADSAYGRDLCRRLRLRRIAASEAHNSQMTQESDRGPLPEATKANFSSAEELGHQRSGFRE